MVKNYDNTLSRFHLIPECHGQTDSIAITIWRVSVLTRDKKRHKIMHFEVICAIKNLVRLWVSYNWQV